MNFSDIVKNAAGSTCIFSLGQAGFIVKSKSGRLLAIDPYLSDCVEHLEGHMGFKRLLPKILAPQELEFDVVIATHGHPDHFDVDAMPGLMANGKTVLYASVGCEKLVKESAIDAERVIYVRPQERAVTGEFQFSFVNCDHGTSAPDAVGVIIEADGKRIYEAGDTCLRLDRIGEITADGGLDVMIAPINGAFGNMNETECAELSGALHPCLTVPCHYGMFASHGGNPGKFFDVMRTKYPHSRMLFMAQGEKLEL